MATVRHFGAFPWCIFPNKQAVADTYFFGNISSVEDAKVFNTLKVSLADAVAMYWRVRTWKFVGAITANSGGLIEGGGTGEEIKDFRDFPLFADPVVANEKSLICRNIDQATQTWSALPPHVAEWETDVGGVATTFFFELRLFSDANPPFGFGLPLSLKNGFAHMDDGMVSVWMDLQHYDTSGGNISFTQIENIGFNEPIDDSIKDVPISFLGKTYTFKARSVPSLDDEDNPITPWGWTLAIEANEYWEYDPGDGGGPIYDRLTGRQLRPFP